jgi:Zn-dependent peptidase ImmA (M78 family)/DNA-binding XRE family transcriptional regulator
MARSARATPNPDLLIWGRRTRGFEVADAAKKAGVKPERLQAWESGAANPTVKQLRKLAHVYRRPLAVFYLPEIPRDFTPLRDYRRLPGDVAGVQTPELMLAVRTARARREAALELYEAEGATPDPFDLRCGLDEDPDDIATRVRSVVGVTMESQHWLPGYEAFNRWRELIEALGVLVLQMRGVDVEEARGFSIADRPLPVISVNMSDSAAGRTFSLLHELNHLMLREGGLCDFDDHTARLPEELQAEIFCNRVAGAILIPADALLEEPLVRARTAQPKAEPWTDEEVQALANRFGSSRIALVRRLLTMGLATENFYQQKQRQYEEEFRAIAKARKAKGAKVLIPPHRLAIATAGPHFVRMVLSAYYGDRITASKVADLLDLKLNHLPKVEADIASRTS